MPRPLTKKVAAYRAMFAPGGKLGPMAAEVLADMQKVCYADRTTAAANPTSMAIAEGRRQVWLHLQRMLNLTDAQVHHVSMLNGDPLE